MIGLAEIITILVAILVAIVLYKLLKTVKSLVINAIVGLLVLVAANLIFSLEIAYTWVVIVICALGGIFGALLIILLNILGIAF
ncbi:pro-sigmaK processing inhibitor BofA family protein [Methanosalsum natronophilum]|uniref:Transcriptional regulator n=1 Tax=Methanosalsum natronophilum TaxID=768733 RepID=A0A3R7VYP5_9EURY|nr:pro-sigmaK processing inhibitor BofA family protein [Methanosalsum natronophilum]MCS3924006.1 putative membrane protein [Methanosalsum natronophilum]RQD88091.1 MAG: transcriptional regulator [Methanosalsum natronophilum]